MYGILTKLVAKPGMMSELLEFLEWDAEVARIGEPGTLRFDVWDVPDQPDAVYLYEAYSDREAFARHQAGEPYKRFVNVIEPELLAEKHDFFSAAHSIVTNADRIG